MQSLCTKKLIIFCNCLIIRRLKLPRIARIVPLMRPDCSDNSTDQPRERKMPPRVFLFPDCAVVHHLPDVPYHRVLALALHPQPFTWQLHHLHAQPIPLNRYRITYNYAIPCKQGIAQGAFYAYRIVNVLRIRGEHHTTAHHLPSAAFLSVAAEQEQGYKGCRSVADVRSATFSLHVPRSLRPALPCTASELPSLLLPRSWLRRFRVRKSAP